MQAIAQAHELFIIERPVLAIGYVEDILDTRANGSDLGLLQPDATLFESLTNQR